MSLSVFTPGADGSPDEQAQLDFQIDLESVALNGTALSDNVLSARNIPDVGSYAAAVLANGVHGAMVLLFAWSGNAEIGVTLTADSLTAPDDAELSHAMAAARDIFNALPQSSAAS